ncbi:putative Negative regulator of sporulation [Clavispora lusitaniae]|uniref:Negative regulator of sporulation n=1 Tax=Clavispora lusitaniae TaxID=36911 RepID=A0ACD0WD16_CLALS|nr:Galactose oxidase, central domain family protein [Clavispora lusitaniae]QFZ25153.1 putative Negative regulator of sporulation [Clavispora lusitaniae]QFZ31544.1 putative Negative regulator of sporulation [Clavispora lusitaniae]QFZ37212.1 putative Negative regulator of sporulation [Clavispora lusitaniae]QFZ42896.1 putative Negative regulator of sporulation [Clavispora lusitaniae]
MSTFRPASSACHMLQLPPTEKDERLNLNVRTGSASVLYNSFVFTFGGITVPLDLSDNVSIENIRAMFSQNVVGSRMKSLSRCVSGELFCLDLINKSWARIDVPLDAPRPKPRMFHELASGRGCIYLFGGLSVSETADADDAPSDLVPMNDLWEFNLEQRSWILLHDGTNPQNKFSIPSPRFCHKMTMIERLPCPKSRDHPGIIIAGGLDSDSKPLYANAIFDLVEKSYLETESPLMFRATSGDKEKDSETGLDQFCATDVNHNVNVNYLNSIIVDFSEEVHSHRHNKDHTHSLKSTSGHDRSTSPQSPEASQGSHSKEQESVLIYSPVYEPEADSILNPLLSFKIGTSFCNGKVLNLQKYKSSEEKLSFQIQRQTIPLRLRYPTGGLFGHNLVITGFLPDDFDISIFIFNKTTGIWSRLNVVCNHEYGTHRFWGGFVWSSHHKVVLLGNYATSKTTSSVRYFSSLITVSLPVTNILASFELANEKTHSVYLNKVVESLDEALSTSSSCDDETSSSVSQSSDQDAEELSAFRLGRKFSTMSRKSDGKAPQNALSFSDYIHYAAPKAKFTKVRSVFPAAAITLGRNAFDRYGDMISDFELISASGDRIPVCLAILVDRWGAYFIRLLSRAYVQAIDHFENEQVRSPSVQGLRSSKSSGTSSIVSKGKSGSNASDDTSPEKTENTHLTMQIPKPTQKETPHFRLPFQDSGSISPQHSRESSVPLVSVDPHRKNSVTSITSEPSLLTSHFSDIPPQLPVPNEPTPPVPATPASYRTSSRKNSSDAHSPRTSLIHTLTALRNIPSNANKSPRASPFASPRGSMSHEPHSFPEPLTRRQSDPSDPNGESLPKDDTQTHPASERLSPQKSTDKQNSMDSQNDNDPYGNTNPPGSSKTTHALLNFEHIDPATFQMEPSLIPRKMYVPFGTESLKAFAEYLYTGQVGNRWALHPCALDCLLMARFFEIPHLYDLLCEVLYGIIGRKEAHLVRQGRRFKERYTELAKQGVVPERTSFPMDAYEGLMNTVDDGYLDIALLRKSSSLYVRSDEDERKVKPEKRVDDCAEESHEFGKSESEKPATDASNKEAAVKADPTSPDSPLHKESPHSSDNEWGFSTPLSEFRERRSGPRVRSVFDRVNSAPLSDYYDDDDKEGSAYTTIEQLVSASAPAPSSSVIDMIYESASLCSDMKLMLRALNTRFMQQALERTEEEFKQQETPSATTSEQASSPEGHATPRLSVASTIVLSGPSTPIDPPRAMSQTSGGLGSVRSGSVEARSASQPEISRSPSAFKLTPHKKSEVESNKDVDRRIAQMIKLDEKIKQKLAKRERAQSKKRPDDDVLSLQGDSSRPGLLRKFTRTKQSADMEMSRSVGLSRTESSTSLTSGSSRTSKKGFFGLRKKGRN